MVAFEIRRSETSSKIISDQSVGLYDNYFDCKA
jgi:hypothetical protein